MDSITSRRTVKKIFWNLDQKNVPSYEASFCRSLKWSFSIQLGSKKFFKDLIRIFMIHGWSGFLKMGHPRPLFLYFRLFKTQLVVNKCSIEINKFLWWRDSNRGPLVLEATALPTEPQPLPWSQILLDWILLNKNMLLFECNKGTYSKPVKLERRHTQWYFTCF